MKKFVFGSPEKLVPSVFCDGFNYTETPVSFKESDFIFRQVKGGCIVEFETEPDTRVYGFGLQLKQFEHTGHKLTMRTNADPCAPSGDTHAPVPFFVTNKGYGMYFDTARYAEFHCGVKKADSSVNSGKFELKLTEAELYSARESLDKRFISAFIPNCEGITVYVIEGSSIKDIVAQYNMLSGGGCEVPEWGLGVLYRCNGGYNHEQIMEVARYMRDNEIPCDILGLEPGWQSRAYSCTYVWNKERFPDPKSFIKELKNMGYHINLWEHAFVHPECPIHDKLLPYSGNYRVWDGLVPDFATPEAVKIFSDYQRENLTDLGIDGFKADECDGSDFTGGWSFPNFSEFPSGLDGERYHNLFGVLYSKTMWKALGNKPTLSEVRSMGSLAAPYPFVLYSDLYDHRDFVRGVVNSGLSGLLWSPEFRHAQCKKDVIRRLQTVVFSVQCLINAWNCPEIPWLHYDCVPEVRELLELRHSLIPMLKAAFEKYHTEGIPPVRPLIMDFTEDENVYDIDDEYMFCDDLLVAPIIGFESDEREVYLPDGEWENYFTRERVAPGKFKVCTEGIPVYRRINR